MMQELSERWKDFRSAQLCFAYCSCHLSYSGSYSTPYQFTGQYVDDLALNYMNSRYYDRSIGMFISPDTIVPDAGIMLPVQNVSYRQLQEQL